MVRRLLLAMGVKHGMMFRLKHLRHVVPQHGILNKLKKLHGRGGVERKAMSIKALPEPTKIGGKARHVLQFR